MTDELDSDQIRLLAYLDSLLQGPKQRSLQNKDQEAYMQDVLAKLAAKMESNLTAKDVEVKLWDMFKSRSKWSKWPEFNIPMLFHHGSSELYLKRETTKLVEEQLRAILLKDAMKDTPRSGRSRSAALLPVANTTNKTQGSKRKRGVPKIRSKGFFKKSRLTPGSPVSWSSSRIHQSQSVGADNHSNSQHRDREQTSNRGGRL
ncbi:hypothetical protein FB567DRAFT_95686 [Paraphoma chrysanthemicola]|uniref:Uncharacterized protein n=1 Tax=Paraphoma chrysanthemicola TaxID=798071 RepID=A0A8K0R2U7_9PLEO|nr:hypothetical protein FB567DRAFT_95686 [Paraphoma chrysanthemicola]